MLASKKNDEVGDVNPVPLWMVVPCHHSPMGWRNSLCVPMPTAGQGEETECWFPPPRDASAFRVERLGGRDMDSPWRALSPGMLSRLERISPLAGRRTRNRSSGSAPTPRPAAFRAKASRPAPSGSGTPRTEVHRSRPPPVVSSGAPQDSPQPSLHVHAHLLLQLAHAGARGAGD